MTTATAFHRIPQGRAFWLGSHVPDAEITEFTQVRPYWTDTGHSATNMTDDEVDRYFGREFLENVRRREVIKRGKQP